MGADAFPLISVIVPVFNSIEYINAGVDSLLKQTWENMEIILVDDGSTDGSSQRCDELSAANSRIKCLHQANQGIFHARINGVRIAEGEIIGFMDSDDVAEPDMFERLARNLIENNADISHCGYKMVCEGVEKLYYGTGKRIVQSRNEGVKDLLEGRFIEPTACTKIYKRELFDGITFPQRIDTAEDLLLNYILFSKSKKAVYEDITPYHYIRRSSSYSKTTDFSSQEKDFDAVLEYMDCTSENDQEIRQFVKNKIAVWWILKYNWRIKKGKEACKALRSQIPEDVSSTYRKTRIQLAMIRHVPALYNGMYRIKRMMKT